MTGSTVELQLSFGDDGFALIRMVNGENRFRDSTIQEWNTVLDNVLEIKSVRGVLITGSGKYFSNGIDLSWMSEQSGDVPAQYMKNLCELLTRILVFPIPTVALLNGHAFGGGAFLAIACDFRVMRPDRGWLNWPETVMGMRIPLPLLKIARTKMPPGVVQREALLFAKRLTGEQAKRLGLVDELTDEAKLADVAKQLVNQVHGKKVIGRKIYHTMKKDIYSNEIDFSKL